MKKLYSLTLLIILTLNISVFTLRIQPVKAQLGTIYIRADGSIDPPTAPISTLDNVTYALTDKIDSAADGIVIQRSNIILDGKDNWLNGNGGGVGVNIQGTIEGIFGVTVKSMQIKGFGSGIEAGFCVGGIINGNYITLNNRGIDLETTVSVRVVGNVITGNGYGNLQVNSEDVQFIENTLVSNTYGIWIIWIMDTNSYTEYHNNFINNQHQVLLWYAQSGVWDDGYPSGGNYWSDYLTGYPNAKEIDSSGIGDTPYVIDANNIDHYPLMKPWSPINQPPSTPTVPKSQKVNFNGLVFKGQSYGFKSSATDPDGDDVSITFNWGDGTQDTVGPSSSGSTQYDSHTWTHTGMYEVTALATDINGAKSDWSLSLEVTVITKTAWNDGYIHGNWGGYMINYTSPSITSVEGQWNVPVFGTDTNSANGIWVGIGGNPGSLLQVGVQAVTQASTRTVQYSAFCEKVPGWKYVDTPSNSHCWIFPGDSMDASIVQVLYGVWNIQINDLTQGWTLKWSSVIYLPDQTSAEWVLELGAGGTDLPSSFGTIEFGSATIGIDSTVYKMGMAGHSLATELWQIEFDRDTVAITSTSPIHSYNDFDILDTHMRPLSGNKQMTLTGSGNIVVIIGGSNVLDATQATATVVIKTGVGNDIIKLGGGNNIVTESAGGNDIITTGNGDNTITITGNGNYQITTGSGNDQIKITGDGNSIIKAGDGNNLVTASGKGTNQITTGSGKDVVATGNGNNVIKTGAGDDAITVGNGNNNIDGGTGYDVCVVGTGHNTILNCEKITL